MSLNTFIQIGEIVPKNIVIDAVRTILMAIDSVVFSAMALVFEMIFSIVKLDQMSIITDLYSEIQEKTYIIIGIYMIFKVILSLLTYFANPDKLNDKEIGGGKLVTRIITSLVLLIFVPTVVFPLLDDIQIPLVNTVGKIVTGNVTSIDDNTFLNDGQEAAISLMSTIFYPDPECYAGGNVNDFKINNIFDTVNLVNLPCESSSGTVKNKYMYTYVFGISHIIALTAEILLIIIAINVAIRAFKLMVLKILAPIPILSYIEPKSAKDGMLASYTKLFTKTYIDLFIQFGVFYLVMLLIGRLRPAAGGIFLSTAEHVRENPISAFSFIFIFIGLLVFAIMAPKFIKKAFNIKESEFGTGLAGMLTTGAMVAGATGSAVSGYNTSASNGGSTLQNVGAGIAGAIGGVATGARSGFGNGKADYGKVLSSISDRNARARADSVAGVSMGHRFSNLLGSTFMGQSPFERQKEIVEGYDDFVKSWDSVSSSLKSEASKGKYGSVTITDSIHSWKDEQGNINQYKPITGTSKEFAGAVRAAEAANQTIFKFGNQDIRLEHASYIQAELEKAETANLYNQILNYDSLDEATKAKLDGIPDLMESVNQLSKDFENSGVKNIDKVGSTLADNYKAIDDQVKQVKAESTRVKHSTDYMASKAAAKK